ncbi:hypothetical protein [Chimaeribacter arupi]|nr:hypothetical protein [Chimaeribacter arupi]WKZ94066.1 hypothetical protein P0E69_09420 [Chimaeribacter arupi]
MKFTIAGQLLIITISGSSREYPNNAAGYQLMAREFCQSKGLLP